MKRRIGNRITVGIGTGCLGALVLLTSACGTTDSSPPAATKTVPATVSQPRAESDLTTVRLTEQAIVRLGILTEAVTREKLVHSVTLGGTVVEAAGVTVDISAPIAGHLTATQTLTPGLPVDKGQELFRLEPLEPALRGQDPKPEAQRTLEVAEARLREADQRLTRSRQLLADGAGSQKAVELAQTEVALARADQKAATAQLQYLKENPVEAGSGFPVLSPHSGTLLEVRARSGQIVAAGSLLARVTQYDPIWVRVAVYAGEVAGIERTANATIKPLGAPAWRRTARPATAPPSANPDASTVHLYYQLANPNLELKPGQRVKVELASTQPESVLTVPWSAVVSDAYGGEWVYESRGEGVFVRRRVEVCRIEGTRAVLCQGPAVGTPIVSVGAAELLGTEFGVGK